MKDVCTLHNVWYNLGDKCPECNREYRPPLIEPPYIPNQKMFRIVKWLAIANIAFFAAVILGVVLLNSK